MLTCVTQGPLTLVALLIVPLAGLRGPPAVHLHAVLVGARASALLAVVWLAPGPVGRLWRQALVGADPSPDAIVLADADPKVAALRGQPALEMLNLLLVLDGHHVCVVLSAPGSGILPVHRGVGVVVRPAFHTAPHAHDWGWKQKHFFSFLDFQATQRLYFFCSLLLFLHKGLTYVKKSSS